MKSNEPPSKITELPKQPLTFDQMDTEVRMKYLNQMVQNLSKAIVSINAVSEAFQRHDHINGKIVFYPPKVK